MKTKLFAFCLISLSLAACKKEITLETKHIRLSERNEQWNININRPAFSTTKADIKSSCLKCNDEIKGLVDGIYATFIEQAKKIHRFV